MKADEEKKEEKTFILVASFITFDSINFSVPRYPKMSNLSLSSILMHAIVQHNECGSLHNSCRTHFIQHPLELYHNLFGRMGTILADRLETNL